MALIKVEGEPPRTATPRSAGLITLTVAVADRYGPWASAATKALAKLSNPASHWAISFGLCERSWRKGPEPAVSMAKGAWMALKSGEAFAASVAPPEMALRMASADPVTVWLVT